MQKFLQEIVKKYNTTILAEQCDEKKFFSSGSLVLDRLIGGNGYPKKRIVEIFGQPATGKTTLAIHAIAEMQKSDERNVAFFDIERTVDMKYMKMLGVNLEKLALFNTKNAEETFNIIIELISSQKFSLIVLDSVAALLPEDEKKGSMEKILMGLQARIMSKALRKINYLLSEKNVTVIFINQLRDKLKIMFGNPEITSGGNALRFYASLRIGLRRKGKITKNDQEIGVCSQVRTVKNKQGTPFRFDFLNFYFGEGMSLKREILELGIQENILKKKGNWIWYNEQRLDCGIEKSKLYLDNNPKLTKELFLQIKNSYKEK